MINGILASWALGLCELIVIFMVFFVIFVIPTVLIVLLVVYVVQSYKEKRRLRMEVEKLVEEVSKLKQRSQ